MTEVRREGGCQCGHIRYVAVGEPVLAAICHSTMCRKANSAPVVAWAMFPSSQVTFTQAAVKQYVSSAEAQRGFCSECGTQICFTANFLPDLVDIALGSLDEPEAIAPTMHFWHSEHLSWMKFADELPVYSELPPFGEEGT